MIYFLIHLHAPIQSPEKQNLADTKHRDLHLGRAFEKVPGSLATGFSPLKAHTLCMHPPIGSDKKQNVDI